MAIDLDDEILQDFLVEAGEILELLSEQLVELEAAPNDADLLNAVFRGFHTVKGGAGFLALDSMVDCCHVCEDVFNVLRNGERAVSSGLMDCVLQGLDSVQIMFTEIQEGSEPTPATPELLAKLKVYSFAGDNEPDDAPAAAAESAVEAVAPVEADTRDVTDDEFDALLDAMDENGNPEVSADAAGNDISDDEFESLLDDLHGKGKHSGGKPEDAVAATDSTDDVMTDDEFDSILDQMHGEGKGPTAGADTSSDKATESNESVKDAGASDNMITDDEFDAMLDQMHGKGKGPTAADAVKPAAPAPVAKAAATPVPKKENKPPAKPAAEASVRVDKIGRAHV